MKRPFNPLIFLAALGAGGIAVMPFAFLQYTFQTKKGLITLQQIDHGALSGGQQTLFYTLEGVMLLFALIHFALIGYLGVKLYDWMKDQNQFQKLLNDPLKNSAILAPLIAISMSFNVFIGVVRFFIPVIHTNFQNLMIPALIAWAILWAVILKTVIKLLKISFTKSFDVGVINFGWLLHPFALGMISVSGMGIAAMAKNSTVAHTAAFMSLITGTMGLFLLVVKVITIFKSHFAAEGLPEKQFLPSFLIVIPNITLFALTFYRFGHYLEHHMGVHLHGYFIAVVVIPFAFQTWYLIFGMSLLSDYFKKHFFTQEYYVSLWAFICPFVGYAVLGSFFYKVFVPNPIVYTLILVTMVVAITFFALVAWRQLRCKGILKKDDQFDCAAGASA